MITLESHSQLCNYFLDYKLYKLKNALSLTNNAEKIIVDMRNSTNKAADKKLRLKIADVGVSFNLKCL